MTSEMHRTLLDRTRTVLRDVSEAFSLLDNRFSTSDTRNVELLHEVAATCSPAVRRQQILGLCDEIEMILDARVSGWLSSCVEQEISSLEQSLHSLAESSIHVSHHLSRYAGVAGYIRALADFATSRTDNARNFLDPSRDDHLGLSITKFGDALLALICALESAISKHIGELFRYRSE